MSPNGFQWFDLMDQTSDEILTKSLVAEIKLNKLIDEVKTEYKLPANKIILCGFSQGCMISLQTGLKREDKINSVIGYSGKIIDILEISSVNFLIISTSVIGGIVSGLGSLTGVSLRNIFVKKKNLREYRF